MKIKLKFKIQDEHFIIRYLYSKNINILTVNKKSNFIIITIYYRDYLKLKFDDKHIYSYNGFKLLKKNLLQNKHFIISLILSIILMKTVSMLVIDIDVIHGNKEIREIIEDELEKYGIHELMFKKNFKAREEIKNKILEDYKDKIEWLEIVDLGMKYTVRVEERIITKKEETPEYCEIVSNKDAIVLGIIASKGQIAVNINDYVKKGSTLISGQIKFNENTKNYVCASGEVYGNTWYTVNVSVPLNYKNKKFTGKKKTNIGLLFGSNYVEVFKNHFDKFDVNKKKIFSIGKFTLYKETAKEYNLINDKRSADIALEVAMQKGRGNILKRLGSDAEILSEKVLQSKEYDSIIDIDIFYSIKERIDEITIKDITKEEEGAIENESTQ